MGPLFYGYLEAPHFWLGYYKNILFNSAIHANITERSVSNVDAMKNITFSKSALVILKEAENLFAQKGFKATSISEIANKTGGSKANIYHHFKSKEHLYQVNLKLACERVFNVFEPSKDKLTSSPKKSLKENIALHLKNMIEQPNSINLIKRELMDDNQIEGRMLAQDIFTNAFKKVTALISEASSQTQKSTPSDSNITASMQAFMLIGVNVFFFESQSVMKCLPGISSFSDYPEIFSSSIFDMIIDQDFTHIIEPNKGTLNV